MSQLAPRCLTLLTGKTTEENGFNGNVDKKGTPSVRPRTQLRLELKGLRQGDLYDPENNFD